MTVTFNRRRMLASLAGLCTASRGSRAEAALALSEHELIDLRLPGQAQLGNRITVYTPKHTRGGTLPVLVLLHGLGETGNDRDGAYAWAERYGLLTSYERLLHPPVDQGLRHHRFLPKIRAEAIDRELMLYPFRGMILVCPYTPNVFQMNTMRALDDYAAWLVEIVLPEVHSRTPSKQGLRFTALDGCSLGGFISYQVFLRRPEAFYCCGGVQAAIGKDTAAFYAQQFHDIVQRLGPRRFHLETSTQDPYHDANVQLARQLERRGVEHDLRVLPGRCGRGPRG